MFENATNYCHTKTGNIYEYLTDVSPTNAVPKKFTSCLTASCSETLEKVKIYYEDNEWYFVTEENPNMHQNTSIKVLYERDTVLWLRSKDMFHEPVVINGEKRPRFEKVEDTQ